MSEGSRRKRIAIVGSLDYKRNVGSDATDQPHPLALKIINDDKDESQATALEAARAVGRALAASGCDLSVYSSGPKFVECHVVEGFLASDAVTNSDPKPLIHVHRPASGDREPFSKQAEHPESFREHISPEEEWEVSFYRSLRRVDGIVILGGGTSTFITGMLALALHIPLVSVADFGGSAYRIWSQIRPGVDRITEAQRQRMFNSHTWVGDQRAYALVDALKEQILRRDELAKRARLRELLDSDFQLVGFRNESLPRYATLAALMFMVALLIVAAFWQHAAYAAYSPLSFVLMSLAAGISGALVRTISDTLDGEKELPDPDQPVAGAAQRDKPSRFSTLYTDSAIRVTAALGLIAGGLATLLFVVTQLSAAGGDVTVLPEQLARLMPIGLGIAFIAGLTLDSFFRSLLQQNVLRAEVLKQRIQGS
ncbi:MAG: hypothetical protein AAF772_14930 [Acidobacteriota bacterium]